MTAPIATPTAPPAATPHRTVVLHCLGLVEEEGRCVGRVAETLRVLVVDGLLLARLEDDPPDAAPQRVAPDGLLARVVRGVLAQAGVALAVAATIGHVAPT